MLAYIRYTARNFIGRYPILFFPIYHVGTYLNKWHNSDYLYFNSNFRRHQIHRNLLLRKPVTKNTQLVIEGFPRSANTYTLFAINYVQPFEIKFAHHWHVPAQVIKAFRLGIPTLVLIRVPIEAISSYLLYNPKLPTRKVIQNYISYYKTILPYKKGLVVASFEDVIQHLDKVVISINDRFNKNFEVPFLSKEDIKQVIGQIKQVNLILNRGIEKLQAPSRERNVKKKLVIKKLKKRQYISLMKNAERVYETFISDR